MIWLYRVIIFGFFRILKFLLLIDSLLVDSWKIIFIIVMYIFLCWLIFVLWIWEWFIMEIDGWWFFFCCFVFWIKCFLSFCVIKFILFYWFMKNIYYDSLYIDVINFFEYIFEFSFCVFFVFEYFEVKFSIWIDFCIIFGFDKIYVCICELYKLVIVVNLDIMMILVFYLLFFWFFNVF